MARKSKIKVGIEVTDNGTLKKVEQTASKTSAAIDKVGQATDKTTKKRNTYQRQEKGVGQVTSNSTKAFAKQAQTVGGTLVPAYAVLAANIFAITAAFGALKRSAAIEQLNTGLQVAGRSAGQNLEIIAKGLKDITGNAISASEAMKAVALGASAGFSQSQMEGLAQVAKGASLALGRDMTDALDRLTRGAAKLEPEILDELGIMVRLDEAVSDYASTLGRTAGSLTQFERRMAFTNAIIDQGQRKFAAIQEFVDPNPYDQLSAAFSELAQSGIKLINGFLTPVVSLLANNQAMLIGVMGIFGTTVARQMIPGIDDAAQAMASQARSARNALEKNLEYFDGFTDNKGNLQGYIKASREGLVTDEQTVKAKTQLNSVIASQSRRLKSLEKDSKANAAAIEQTKITIDRAKAAQTQLSNSFAINSTATLRNAQAKGVNAAATLTLTNATTNLNIIFKSIAATYSTTYAIQLKNAASTGILSKSYAGLRTIVLGTASAFKILGTAILSAIPIVGQLILLGSLLYEGLKWMFEEEPVPGAKAVTKALEDQQERLQEFPKVIDQLALSYELANSRQDKFISGLRPLSGLISQSADAISNFERSQRLEFEIDKAKKVAEANQKILDLQRKIEQMGPVKTGGQPVSSIAGLQSPISDKTRQNLINKGNEAALTALQDQLEAAEQLRLELDKTKTRDFIVTELQTLKMGLEDGLSLLDKQSEEYSTISKALIEVNSISKNLNDENLAEAEGKVIDIKNGVVGIVKAFDDARSSSKALMESLKSVTSMSGTTSGGQSFVGALGLDDTVIKNLDTVISAWSQAGENADLKSLEAEYAGIFEELNKLEGLQFKWAAFKGDKEALEELKGIIEDISYRYAVTLPKALQAYQTQAAKFREAGLESRGLGQDRQALTAQISLQRELVGIAKGTVDEAKETIKLLQLEEQLRLNGLAITKEQAEQNRRLYGDTLANAMAAGNLISDNLGVFNSVNTDEKIRMMTTAMQPMFEELRKLGPEGELIAQVSQGAMVLAESFTLAFEKIEAGTFGMTDGLQIAAGMIGQISSMMNARAKAKEASIDREIAAEKKLDGKSAESTAKILALEKKKEAAQRKAFEIDKKMKLAQAVISTALGVNNALASAPPPFNFVLAGLVGAMGAAQVALISGMSFEGGNASAASVPSSVSVGNRMNSVDFARSRSASGEIAYARGESGIGTGMSSFTPRGAFTGMQMRSAGGNTGLMVGEQGPEMFIPERPGRIVPADEVGAMGGGMNVTFEIHAIDSTGFVDIIQGHKGEFIGMLREAANAHGETFMESVNIHSLPPTGSKTRAASLRQFTKEK